MGTPSLGPSRFQKRKPLPKPPRKRKKQPAKVAVKGFPTAETGARAPSKALPAPLPPEALVEASKAIYDAVKELLDNRLGEMEGRFKSLEAQLQTKMQDRDERLHMHFGKALEGEFRKMVEGEFVKRLPAHADEFRDMVDTLRSAYQFGMSQIELVLRGLPTPNVQIMVPEQRPPDVHVTSPAITNQVMVPDQQAIFNVHVPELKLPQINVQVPEQHQPVVNVHVPQQERPEIYVNAETKPSIVNVTMPEQKAPDVHVTVPEPKSIVNVTSPDVHVNLPRRKLRKTFRYDEQTGRPLDVVEEEMDERA